jgi:hypothetical protein
MRWRMMVAGLGREIRVGGRPTMVYPAGHGESEMKNLVILGLVIAALVYGQRSCTMPGQRLASEKPEAGSYGGGPAREWQQAPKALMDMQGAMGGARSGAANAARDAVRDQVGR